MFSVWHLRASDDISMPNDSFRQDYKSQLAATINGRSCKAKKEIRKMFSRFDLDGGF
jgi:hypothetical protein